MSQNPSVYRPTGPACRDVLGDALDSAFRSGKSGASTYAKDTAIFELRYALDQAGYDLIPKGVQLPSDEVMEASARLINLDLDDSLGIASFDPDVSTGVAKVGDDYVRLVHVLAARSYTIPLAADVTPEQAMRLAAAVIEWDVAMMENQRPPQQAVSTIRGFLPRMRQCELRDVYVDVHGYAGKLS